MRTGAHAFKAGVEAILASGKCYWMVIVHPNSQDTFLPMVFGTLSAASMAGYTVVPGALIDMSDIDQSIDIQKDTMAKKSMFDFSLTNFVYTIDYKTVVNHNISVRFGYGETMSIATSDLMFSGIVKECTPSETKIKFTCNESVSLDYEIGTIVDSEIDVGKIAPIIHGDFSTGLTPTIKKLSSSGSFVVSSVPGRSKYGTSKTKFYLYKNNKVYKIVSSKLYNYVDIDGDSYLVTDSSAITYSVSYSSQIPLERGVCINKIAVSSTFYNKVVASIDGKSKVLVATKSIYGDGLYSVFDKSIDSGKYYIYLSCISKSRTNGIPMDSTAYLINEDDPGFFTVEIVAKAQGSVKFGYPDYLSSIKVLLDHISQGQIAIIQEYKNIRIAGDDRDASGSYNWSYQIYPCYEDFDIEGQVVSAELLIKSAYTGGNSSSVNDYWEYKTSKASLGSLPTNTIKFYGTLDTYYDNEQQEGLLYSLDVGVPKSKTLAEYLNDGHYFQFKRNRQTTTPTNDSITLESIGLRIWIACKVADSNIWAQSYGLACPTNDYYTVSYGALIENPLSIIEDYFRYFFPNNSISSIDRTSLEEMATARSSWKLATALYTECKLNG